MAELGPSVVAGWGDDGLGDGAGLGAGWSARRGRFGIVMVVLAGRRPVVSWVRVWSLPSGLAWKVSLLVLLVPEVLG